MTNAVLARPTMLNPWIVAARGAAVDVFDQALSLRGRALDTGVLTLGSVGALIPIVSELSPVQIGVFASEPDCTRLARALLYAAPTDPITRAEMIDAMCEIANMLAGSVKARVTGYATHAALGLPTFVHGPVEAATSTAVDVVPIAVDDLVTYVVIVRAIDA